MHPFISCVCPTTPKRVKEFLPRAIECFNAQTWIPRELVIALDIGDEESAQHILPLFTDLRAHIIYAPAGLTLGAKRNFINQHSHGTLIAHWDDDDWSAPARLQAQYEHFVQGGNPVTGLNSMKFTDGTRWWRYVGDTTWPLGTSLFYTREWWEKNQFHDQQAGSDTVFTGDAVRENALTSVSCGDLMFASVHEGNITERIVDHPANYTLLDATEGIKWQS